MELSLVPVFLVMLLPGNILVDYHVLIVPSLVLLVMEAPLINVILAGMEEIEEWLLKL